MSAARYEFETDKQYFAWVVAAEQHELPGVDEFIRAIKITLAMPYYTYGEELLANNKPEAVIWVVMSDKGNAEDDATTEFLNDAGVVRDDNGVWPPKVSVPRLSCRFGKPQGNDRYQRIADWDVIPRNKYPDELVIVANRAPIDLILNEADSTATRVGMDKVELGPVAFQLLWALRAKYPNRVSLVQLRRDIKAWNANTPNREGTIDQAVSTLRQKLEKHLGYTITPKRMEEGWALAADDR